MDRAELEALDRDALIAYAEANGVARARILTRPELVDEVLVRRAAAGDRAARKARGFFGRARDLLARVVELGLNLPEAAELLRGAPPPPPPPPPAPLPTVTLAEIYAAQGHRDRALATLRDVLSREPDHAEASRLLRRLEADGDAAPAPLRAAEPEVEEAGVEPREEVDDCEDDVCVARPSADGGVVVEWRVGQAAHARAAGEGELVLRVVAIAPTWDGPRTATRDEPIAERAGTRVVADAPAIGVTLLAVGWRHEGEFVPFAHAAVEAA